MDAMNVTEQPEYRDLVDAPAGSVVVLIVGLLSAVTLYCTGQVLQKSYQPAMFCSPFFVGAIVGLFAIRHPVRAAIKTVFVALLLSVFALREGVICCIMVLPVVVPVTILGAVCTSSIGRYVRGRRARAVLGTLLVVAAIGWQAAEGALDEPARHPIHVARSFIVIPAPPERVFATLATRDLAVRDDWPWFLRIGLPMAGHVTYEAPEVGGRVTATFSQGVAHGHVTEWIPGRTLAYAIDRYEITDLPFHITRLGRSPSYGLRAERVEDWLTILSTRFDIVPLASGRTELRREVVWRRHLAPAIYFGWLQQTVIQRGQDRLLALIRERVIEGIMAPWPSDPTPAQACRAFRRRAGPGSSPRVTGPTCAARCSTSCAPPAGSPSTFIFASKV
jgi:hypothetical protein